MTNQPTTTSTSPIQHLAPRLASVRAALDHLEPILGSICEKRSPLYDGIQSVFDQLLDEQWAIQTLMLALPAIDTADLLTQATIAREYAADHLPGMPLLGQFLDRVEAFAA